MSETTTIEVTLSPAELQVFDQWVAANGFADRDAAARRLIQLGMKVATGSGGDGDIEPASD